MFKKFLLISAFGALVACGTPQEECINRETRDLRVVDRLIAEAEGNLKRGFAYEDVEIFHSVWVRCDPFPEPAPTDGTGLRGRGQVAPRLCLDDREQTVSRPKAIDLAAERAKLAGLKAQRVKLVAAADRSIAACRKAYPE